MKGRKIITISIIINLILVVMVYILISKVNVNNKKQIIKEMSEIEYEDYIKSLNTSHEDYAKYIEESKKKIARAITDMGVQTSYQETLETMANNIKSISINSSENISFPTLETKTNTYFFYNAGYKFVDYNLQYNADHSSVAIYANNEPTTFNAKLIASTEYNLVSQTIKDIFEIENYKYIIVVGSQYFGYDHSSYATLSFIN